MSLLRFIPPVAGTALFLLGVAQAAPLPLQNPGFESGLAGWTFSTTAAVATVAEAHASLGAKGLRLKDVGPAPAYTVSSVPLPAVAGRVYRLDFWSRSLTQFTSGIKVELRFLDASGNTLTPGAISGFRSNQEIAHLVWFGKTSLKATAPAGTATLRVVIESLAAYGGGAELDDFLLVEENAGETEPSRLADWLAEIAADPHRGRGAPQIVLKLDDVKLSGAVTVAAGWPRVAGHLAARNIRSAMGIICNSLAGDTPVYFDWITQQAAGGLVEFWNHGLTHLDGEFTTATYAQQKHNLVEANRLALEKAGLRLRSFGAPFNGTNNTTVQVLAEDADIGVWLFGDFTKNPGQVILGRANNVNLETPTGAPNHEAFIEGYAHNRGAAYFVLQGHPAGWDDARFTQFGLVVDFLSAQGAHFVFPAEFIPGSPGVNGWRASHFTSLELARAEISGDLADPDLDGLPNLLEYALGTAPRAADPATAAMSVASLSSDPTPRLRLVHRVGADLAGVAFDYETSTDLVTWTPATPFATETYLEDGATWRRVTLASVTTPRLFARLRVRRR